MECIRSRSVSMAFLKQTRRKIFHCSVTNFVTSKALSDTSIALSFFSVQKSSSQTREREFPIL